MKFFLCVIGMVMIVEGLPYFAFPAKMEEKYGLAGHNIDGNKRVFFRGNKSTEDIINSSKERINNNSKYNEIRIKTINSYTDSLSEGGCSESCESFAT